MSKERCGHCNCEMEPNTPEEEAQALAEYASIFPNAIKMNDERVAVCDACWELMRPDKWPAIVAASETYPELN